MKSANAIALFLTALNTALGASDSAARNPRDGLLMMLDHAATSAAAAQRCDQHEPGSGESIRAAHARWHAQHHTAQMQIQQRLMADLEARRAVQPEPAGAPDARHVLALFQTASLNKLQQSMAGLDAAALSRFCAGYPQEFEKPEMDATALLLKMM
jgi:hypothetical protein